MLLIKFNVLSALLHLRTGPVFVSSLPRQPDHNLSLSRTFSSSLDALIRLVLTSERALSRRTMHIVVQPLGGNSLRCGPSRSSQWVSRSLSVGDLAICGLSIVPHGVVSSIQGLDPIASPIFWLDYYLLDQRVIMHVLCLRQVWLTLHLHATHVISCNRGR